MSHLLPLITAVGRKFLPMQMCYFVMSHQIASALYLGTKRGGGWDRMWLQMEPKGFLKHRLKIENWDSDAFSSKNPWKGKSSLWRQKWKAGWGVWEEGVLDGNVGRCRGKAAELLIWANPLCAVRVVWSGCDPSSHIHRLWCLVLTASRPCCPSLLGGMHTCRRSPGWTHWLLPNFFFCLKISDSYVGHKFIYGNIHCFSWSLLTASSNNCLN